MHVVHTERLSWHSSFSIYDMVHLIATIQLQATCIAVLTHVSWNRFACTGISGNLHYMSACKVPAKELSSYIYILTVLSPFMQVVA